MTTNAKVKETIEAEGSLDTTPPVKENVATLKAVDPKPEIAKQADSKSKPKAKSKSLSGASNKSETANTKEAAASIEKKSEEQNKTTASPNPATIADKKKTGEPNQQIKKQNKRPPKKQFSKSEHIKNQANPKSILVGRQKTLTLRYEYCSDILHEYLQMNQATMLAAYERLAGLLRLVATDKVSYAHVNDWIATNLTISQEQVANMQSRRSVLAEDCNDEIESLNISVPDNYHTEFQASHPVCHKMLAVLRLIDTELNASEDLFMAGIIDDASYMALRTEATSIVRGSVDRIYKATSPGTREGGRYAPSQLASWIRSGNKMLFADVPKELLHLTQQKDA